MKINNTLKKQINIQTTNTEELKVEMKSLKSKNVKLMKLAVSKANKLYRSEKVNSDRQKRETQIQENSHMDTNTAVHNDVSTPDHSRIELLAETKERVVPKWRQIYFKRRDDFKREYRNLSKAKTYEHYANIKFLPRKFRPKHARTLDEYNVKEAAAFKSLDADMQCCHLDAQQAQWNYCCHDLEIKHTINEKGANQTEKDLLLKLWKQEVSDAEPKAK